MSAAADSRWLPPVVRAALAPVAGALFGASFPKPGWSWCAVVGLGLTLALIVTARPRRAFAEAFVAGFVFFSLLVRWFAAVLLVYSNLGPVIAAAAVLASGAVFATMFAVIAAALARLAERCGVLAGLAASAVAWVGLEVFRAHYPFPFPWGILAAAFSEQAWANAAVAWVGTAGLSLLLAAASAAFAALLVGRWRTGLLAGAACVALAAGAAAGGHASLSAAEPGRTVRIAVLQASLDREAHPLDELATYEKLTRDAAERGARVVVWPESAASFRIDIDTRYRRELAGLAQRLGIELVLSSITAAESGGIENSAVLVRGDGEVVKSPKRQLVPFGEYLPLRFLLGSIPALAAEAGDFRPGERGVLFPAAPARLGPLVCFEVVFPSLACELASDGAEVLVNMTNDSWFGYSAGPYQHLAHARLRAAETGRPLVRAANTGISTLIARDGRALGALELMERGFLVANVQTGKTPMPGCPVGRATGIACVTLLGLLLVTAPFLRKARGRAAGDEGG